ncbi:SurA N-terminal domain-containing protein [Streptomyces sp. WMMB 322]|uniref:SurA N-terminal domain-containing protein n=1 Tax=Streptomyces sp. WMMB 322 TaxID=1286821 RepID=UPI0006E129C5|nr:SurA N-terminal domain-containing protein [Streptomyces sp. WMMB 322]SCK10617.1 SurA N-terminal domain-containing protein [Streptomyces sp. WMMB 322]
MHSSTEGSRRRRSALTVSGAAALLVAAPLLTGCGDDAHPGAAAVAGGERISMAQLQAKVETVRNAQRAAPQGAEMIKGSGQLTRAALDSMIRERIVERAAKDAGVSVTRREVGEYQAQLRKQAGGEKRLKDALLQQQAVAPSQIDDWMRIQVSVDKIAKAGGIDPRTPQGNEALRKKFSKTSEKLHISVNPRYGKWDVQAATLGNRTEPWLRDLTGRQQDRQQQQQQPQM